MVKDKQGTERAARVAAAKRAAAEARARKVMSETTTVRLSPEIREGLAKAAEADMRPSSQMLQKILHDWLKERGFIE
jgi:hypothetical protein